MNNNNNISFNTVDYIANHISESSAEAETTLLNNPDHEQLNNDANQVNVVNQVGRTFTNFEIDQANAIAEFISNKKQTSNASLTIEQKRMLSPLEQKRMLNTISKRKQRERERQIKLNSSTINLVKPPPMSNAVRKSNQREREKQKKLHSSALNLFIENNEQLVVENNEQHLYSITTPEKCSSTDIFSYGASAYATAKETDSDLLESIKQSDRHLTGGHKTIIIICNKCNKMIFFTILIRITIS